jgi:hypothetical protein
VGFTIRSWPLSAIPGLSPEHYAQLETQNLHTTQDLLRRYATPGGAASLATTLSLPLRYAQKWLALADLAQLPSVGCEYCGLLLHSGIQSTQQLAIMAPGQLHMQIRRLHATHLRRGDLCPGPDQVVAWVSEAKRLGTLNRGTKTSP